MTNVFKSGCATQIKYFKEGTIFQDQSGECYMIAKIDENLRPNGKVPVIKLSNFNIYFFDKNGYGIEKTAEITIYACE
jgi:hypothetical protein